jgi:hypothetical protein
MPNELGLLQYVPRQQYAMPFEYVQHGVESLKKAHYDALEQQSHIAASIASLELNEAENGWKDKYTQDITAAIDGAAEDGHYATALTRAKQLAGKVASDPALLGRARYQQDFKKFQEQVKTSSDYDQDVKEYALEKNPYAYQDTQNEAGKVTGGNTFAAAYTPTKSIPIESAMKEALQIVAKDAGGSEALTFGDGSGGFTKDYANSDGVAYLKNGMTYERVTKDKLEAALKTVIANTPGMQASIDQEYRVGSWKTQKQNDKGEVITTDVTDGSGRLLTQAEWFKKRLDPFYKAATYNNVIYRTDAQAGLSAAIARKKMGSGEESGGVNMHPEIVGTKGSAITIYGENAASIVDRRTNSAAAINGLAQKYKVPVTKDSNLKATYDAIAANINNSNASADLKKQDLAILSEQYRENIMSNRIAEDYMRNAPATVRQAVEFQSALANGVDLSTLKGNMYADEMAKGFNEAFTKSNGEPSKYLEFEFENFEGYKAVLNKLGVSDTNAAKSKGYDIDPVKHSIRVPREHSINAYTIASTMDSIAREESKRKGSTKYLASRVTKEGGQKLLARTNDATAPWWSTGSGTVLSQIGGSKAYKQANKLADDFLNAPAEPITGTPTIYPIEDVVVAAFRAEGKELDAKSPEVKRGIDDLRQQVITALTHSDGANFKQWYANNEAGKETLREVDDAAKRSQNIHEAMNMLANDPDNTSITMRKEPDGSISTEILYRFIKTSGLGGAQPAWKLYNKIVIPAPIESQALQVYTHNPMFKAEGDIAKARASRIKAVVVNSPDIVSVLPEIMIDMSDGNYIMKQSTPEGSVEREITEANAIYLKGASNAFGLALDRHLDPYNADDRVWGSTIAIDYAKALNSIDKNVPFNELPPQVQLQAKILGEQLVK